MTTTEQTPRRIVKTSLPKEYRDGSPDPLASFLGVFSIGLGLVELFAPDDIANVTGVRNRTLLRAYGLREIASGVGVLTSKRPAGWLWARVAGDILDLATLGAAFAQAREADRRRAALAATAVAGVAVLDLVSAGAHS